jgi:hypothetical protein
LRWGEFYEIWRNKEDKKNSRTKEDSETVCTFERLGRFRSFGLQQRIVCQFVKKVSEKFLHPLSQQFGTTYRNIKCRNQASEDLKKVDSVLYRITELLNTIGHSWDYNSISLIFFSVLACWPHSHCMPLALFLAL